jgi:HK97 gp10 family phage protein
MPATLTSRIPQIVLSLNPRVDGALKVGAEAISQEAKQRVPVETGTLRDAIHVDSSGVGGGWSVIAGDDDAFYGHIIEHGGVNTPPHPFLIPAAESQRDSVAAAVTAVLRTL